MAWYVFALVDERPGTRPGRGLSGALTAHAVPGGFAIVERRADVPPLQFDTLQRHDAVVTRLARAVPAILPVRFGTLLERDEIDAALAERGEELADAFEAVRGRQQFTWRTSRGARGARGAQGAQGASGASGARGAQGASGAQGALGTPGAPGTVGVMSGAEYLRRLAAKAVVPVVFRAVREELRPFVVAERYQAATASVPDSLYHLVDRGRAGRYEGIAKKLAAASPVLRVSGPFPPFAFAPELL